MKHITLALGSLVLILTMTASAQDTLEAANSHVPNAIAKSEVEWGPLNPARGDNSPRAGTLWGDRTDSGPSGFLVRFAEGFSSPPHIHNVTYRGVVISGLIHNDDPTAEKMWLPAGSFWAQPAGEAHITAASSDNNMAYIEIESGPYLVRPTEEAFDNGERPVNVEKSNIVWLDASDIKWVDHFDAAEGPKMAFLWGNPEDNQLSGTLVKLPAAFVGTISAGGSNLRAVVIQGETNYQRADEGDVRALVPGSYFGSTGKSIHHVSCQSDQACVIYVRVEGSFNVTAAQ